MRVEEGRSQKFFVVWRNGATAPVEICDTLEEAEGKANELVRRYSGSVAFYVLQAVSVTSLAAPPIETRALIGR